MTISVLKETAEHENRVALVPESVARLIKNDFRILVQDGAGLTAGFRTSEYEKAGAEIVTDYDTLLSEGQVFLKVQCVCLQDGMMKIVDPFHENSVIIGFFNPFKNIQNVDELAKKMVTTFSMELVPRISRAQKMDALSAMSSAAGYKAVVLAASSLNKFFPMMMTAAGTISPAKVLVIGAGVAGLQAIATAKRLGAKVKAFDTRPIVQEQVESLGAEFVSLDASEEAETAGGYAEELSDDYYRHEQIVIGEQISDTDVVITTAQIFGKRAPLLITEEMVKSMRYGSAIVDLAAEQGGNCELTIAGKSVERYGVTIHGSTDLPGTLSYHSSEMFSRNVTALLMEMVKDGEVNIDLEDEVIAGTILTQNGKILNEHVINLLQRAEENK
ncbi:MAG: Re/Si-specific NAD(P)(+) transhydrogenase subunit alpha [Candidatus Marinimicrobia bacterium]|nr:Re/Si-specific NAD(P)(+) transhydrogenase subunit alpha [Candidatus Neomarinimicrobiota bacterium]MBT3618358.1 Re/Si-specific NAD(P)(+) transhydrogenase subunit alpha [Candidatus Neomarinimicrobiota bacterium]MBT3829153.1 Re/Si-specific NAD(P)(+) transhydrogenase subunit alpha [Candidatus Neomarinimicrobiota bacterium]MBT3998121.1 Re/Si-specific NAD(P)(+) transhydrogenase subunit alpha [Candidatus Neomarinimicrobiota bacterium]MBT4281462.1 Re/Si-specific NAD(P)(+) transhydrogenase subunit al